MKQEKPQFNMREFLESSAYTEKNQQLQSEINGNNITPLNIERSSKSEIEKAKRDWKKLSKDTELVKKLQKDTLSSIVATFKNPIKFNFILIQS